MFAFNALYHGRVTAGANNQYRPSVDITNTPSDGYWIMSAFGRFSSFGGARSITTWSKSGGDTATGMDTDGTFLYLVDRSGTTGVK